MYGKLEIVVSFLKIIKANLKEKTRSIFAIHRNLDFQNLPVDVTNKTFNSLFLPILLYSSEVWGIYDKDDLNSWQKDIIERAHVMSIIANKL